MTQYSEAKLRSIWAKFTSDKPRQGCFTVYTPHSFNSSQITFRFKTHIMRNFPETGEQVINTKKNSTLRWGASRVQRTLFFGIDHEFTCLWEISVIYSDQTGHWSMSVPTGSFCRIIYAWEEYIVRYFQTWQFGTSNWSALLKFLSCSEYKLLNTPPSFKSSQIIFRLKTHIVRYFQTWQFGTSNWSVLLKFISCSEYKL